MLLLTLDTIGQILISEKVLRFKDKSSSMKETTRKEHQFIVRSTRLFKFNKDVLMTDPTILSLQLLLIFGIRIYTIFLRLISLIRIQFVNTCGVRELCMILLMKKLICVLSQIFLRTPIL